MPAQKGESTGEQRENLTTFGGWFYLLCDYLGVSSKEVARRCGMNENAFYHSTRIDDNGEVPAPRRKTVQRMVQVFAQIAQEQGRPWNKRLEVMIWNSAGYCSDEAQHQAQASLTFQYDLLFTDREGHIKIKKERS